MQTRRHFAERSSNKAGLTFVCRLAITLACVAAIAVALDCAAFAQHGASGAGHPANPTPPPAPTPDSNFDQRRIELQSNGPNANVPGQRDSCLLPPLNAIPLSTIDVANLRVSGKARKDYLSACNSLKDRKYDNAEESLRRAVDTDPKYVAAWVTLGQLLSGQNKLDPGREACDRARSADPTYLPSYLCLADIAARSQHWEETLSMSDRALQIDPSNDPIAYDYNAAANFNLHKLDDAERSALKAIEIDRNHIDPRVHFLLAQIYDAKGDLTKEESELREFLKFAGPSDAAMVKQYLSDVQSREKTSLTKQ